MAAGNLEPISVEDREVDYDDYVGVLEGGITGRSERMLERYTEIETGLGERFEAERSEDPNRYVESVEATTRFREELAESYDDVLYPTLSKAGEEDIGGYEEFQDTMRVLAELNYVKLLDNLETAMGTVSSTRTHSSNALSMLNQVNNVLTEKGYTHSTKEPINERINESKRHLKEANRKRLQASPIVKQCYFYFFTADLLIEKYDVDTAEFRYVDLDGPIEQRLSDIREEFVRQEKQIRHGRRSLKKKVQYIEQNFDL